MLFWEWTTERQSVVITAIIQAGQDSAMDKKFWLYFEGRAYRISWCPTQGHHALRLPNDWWVGVTLGPGDNPFHGLAQFSYWEFISLSRLSVSSFWSQNKNITERIGRFYVQNKGMKLTCPVSTLFQITKHDDYHRKLPGKHISQ